MDSFQDGKASALILDSQKFLIDLLGNHLKKDSMKVIGAANGDEARALFDSERPHLAVVNPSVPGAVDFIKHLRASDYPCAVIALTDSLEARLSMEELGIEVILGRDANLQALLTAMRSAASGVTGNEGDDEVARLLVVDDEPELRGVIKSFLNGRGYWVATAGNGPDALQILQQNPDIKVVLLDIKIGEIGGLEVLRQIMGRKPHPEVIMMTGVQDADIARLAFKLGAFDYFTKPFDWQRLDGLITACIAHREYQQQKN